MNIRNKIKQAVDATNRAQRNYDLTKSIPQEDLDTLIYAAVKSPSKQNETHYSLHVYTDQNIIKQIYNHTKKFTLARTQEDKDQSFSIENDVFIQHDYESVTNSQIYANALFVYVKGEGSINKYNVQHYAAKLNPNSSAAKAYEEQIAYSIGISVGELILSAGLLGYKTGICSALDTRPVRDILGTEQNPKLLVGVGIPNSHLERTMHLEVLNKDVPKKFRTGELEEHMKFPSFDKYTKVTINGN